MATTSQTKYGKTILNNLEFEFENYTVTVLVCDGGEYFDIHVIHPAYRDEENNTLELQEPKEYPDCLLDKSLLARGLEKCLWHKYCGLFGSLNSFYVGIDSDIL